MQEMIENRDAAERVLLVAVAPAENDEIKESLSELKELVRTAGGTVEGSVLQIRESVHPATYLGKGKIEEISERIRDSGITGIVCDDELSPAQYNNLTDMLDTKVLDRTMLILDIFASRANTSEGKIQVELAQLRYRAARLTGLGKSLSRLGGGIGTRGPGEKKLEMDRQMAVVYETLYSLGAGGKPVYTLFNKIDRIENGHSPLMDPKADRVFHISALSGEGFPELISGFRDFILEGQILIERLIPYQAAGVISLIRSQGIIREEEYRNDGIFIKALVPRSLYGKMESTLSGT